MSPLFAAGPFPLVSVVDVMLSGAAGGADGDGAALCDGDDAACAVALGKLLGASEAIGSGGGGSVNDVQPDVETIAKAIACTPW